jgi:hypothetical protein
MIVRCPHCGAADTARYRPGRAPNNHRCGFCGEVFAFFPALEIEVAGQPRVPAVADLLPSSAPPVTLQADRRTHAAPPSRSTPRRGYPADAGHRPAAAPTHPSLNWLQRLAGLLAGLTLIATLAGQVLVHQRVMLRPHPELLAIASALCRILPCPEVAWREPAAVAIGSLQLDPRTDGILSVEMEIRNTLDQTQPWPLLEMALSDRHGRILAQRRWHPSEYLGSAKAGMLGAGEVRRLRLVISAPERLPDGVAVWAL